MGGVLLVTGFPHLTVLLFKLGPHVFGAFPVKAATARLLLHRQGLEQGGHRVGDAPEYGFVRVLFLRLDKLPIICYILGGKVLAGEVTEDVRVTELHLVANLREAVGDVEEPLFLRNPGVEHKVVQQVAYLLGGLGRILAQDSIRKLIDLLLGQRAYGLHRLGGVPRAALAKRVHHIQQP